MKRTREWLGLPAASLALAAALGGAPASAQAPAATRGFESAEFGYEVFLPAGCRHQQGPGTLDAICAPDLDEGRSRDTNATTALVFEVAAERSPGDAGKSSEALAQAYTQEIFRQELPEAVCGEADHARVKIDNAKRVLEAARVVYTADVLCPEIKFLALGERRAKVQFSITPGVRYRLMARALKEDFDKRGDTVDAFFTSFRAVPADGTRQ